MDFAVQMTKFGVLAIGSMLAAGLVLAVPLAQGDQTSSRIKPYENTSFSNPYGPGGPYDPHRFDGGRTRAAPLMGASVDAAGQGHLAHHNSSRLKPSSHGLNRVTLGASGGGPSTLGSLHSFNNASLGSGASLMAHSGGSLAASSPNTARGMLSGQINAIAGKNQVMAGDKGCMSARGTGDSTLDVRCH